MGCCYDDLWAGVIESRRPLIAVAPHWEFSRRARKEIGLAFELGLDFIRTDGARVDAQTLQNEWRDADSRIRREGRQEALSAPLPMLPVMTV